MPFANYTELQAAVADWLNRTDLSSRIVDFIALAESKMDSGYIRPGDPTRKNYKLRVVEMAQT